MKISGGGNEGLVVTMGKREKQLFLSMLKQYAMLDIRTQPLTRGGGLPDEETAEELLAQSRAEQRAENLRKLETLFQSAADSPEERPPHTPHPPEEQAPAEHGQPGPKTKRPSGNWRLALSLEDAEWVLQVLNEVRVGAWLRLGSPENRIPKLTPGTAREVWTMEVCGYFQVQLLEALANP